eukprot:3517707-Amphidinium_carterae.1
MAVVDAKVCLFRFTCNKMMLPTGKPQRAHQEDDAKARFEQRCFERSTGGGGCHATDAHIISTSKTENLLPMVPQSIVEGKRNEQP